MKMIINGIKTDASDGAVIEVINPATQELIDTVPRATKEDVDRAIEAAQEGKKIWGNTPMHERAKILYKFIDLVAEHADELAEQECREMGKVIRECQFEVSVCQRIFRGFVERAQHLYGEVYPENQEGTENDIYFTLREPLGVIACVIPFDYPIELWSHKVAPALIMGNAVIIKPATDNPLSDIRLVELLQEAGVPGSAVQVVTGRGSEIGNWLTGDPRVDGISLTGSTEVGIEIAKNAAPTLKHLFFELGGNDATIVCDDANIDLAVDEVFAGRMQNTGQTCCAVKRVIVDNQVKDEFVGKLVAKLEAQKIGNPIDPSTDVGCLISERAAKDVERQIGEMVDAGAVIATGGKRFDHTFVQPTVLTNVTPDMPIAKDLEVFGPVFPIIGYDTLEEGIAIANQTMYGLSAGIITENTKKAIQAAKQLESGCVVVNGNGCYRYIDQAFGGYKMSGLGREGVAVTLEEMSQEKVIALKGILA